MRKKNKVDMTIHEQLETIGEKICNDYCRYPLVYRERYLMEEYDNEDAAMEAMQNEFCVKCPLMEL